MFERDKLEREEGKSYQDPQVRALSYKVSHVEVLIVLQASDKMKSLNKRFGMLHSISSLVNLGVLLSLIFHGLWIANFDI